MSQASACIPPRARVVTFRRAANDNRRIASIPKTRGPSPAVAQVLVGA